MAKLETTTTPETKVNIAVFGKNGSAAPVVIEKELLVSKVKPGMIAQVVRVMLSNEHQGTVAVKDRSEVSGGGRKPWKQKGTGRARQGSIRSPQWVGGGVVHGPQNDKRKLTLPKSWSKKALVELLKQVIIEEALVLIEDFNLEKPKTAELVSALSSIKTKGKTLFILDKLDKVTFLSARNIPNLTLITWEGMNTLSLLRADTIVTKVSSFEKLKKILEDNNGK